MDCALVKDPRIEDLRVHYLLQGYIEGQPKPDKKRLIAAQQMDGLKRSQGIHGVLNSLQVHTLELDQIEDCRYVYCVYLMTYEHCPESYDGSEALLCLLTKDSPTDRSIMTILDRVALVRKWESVCVGLYVG